jgi:hypothetical protein
MEGIELIVHKRDTETSSEQAASATNANQEAKNGK